MAIQVYVYYQLTTSHDDDTSLQYFLVSSHYEASTSELLELLNIVSPVLHA